MNRNFVPASRATASSYRLPDPGEVFLGRVRRAALSVLGDSEVGRAVRGLCDAHETARQSLTTDRTAGEMVIAVVGATGQGKSWLLRQFVRCPRTVAAIRSGNNLDQATERLTWVGPSPPAELDHRHELYLHCDLDQMFSLGVPYWLVDAPGATDERPRIAELAEQVLSMADVLILVVRHDQLRSSSLDALAVASEGAIVIPVINAVRRRDEAVQADVDELVARIRRSAPSSVIAAAVLVDDFALDEHDESQVASAALEQIGERIRTQLDSSGGTDSRHGPRLAALDARFQGALHRLLSDELPSLTIAVNRLRDAADALPTEIAESLVGGGPALRAAVRSRLRANLLTDTAAIWFPYRSLLGLLSLTSGAWDRVVLSLAGSLPSLIGAAWVSAKNVSAEASGNRAIRDGLKQRAAAVVADRLGPLTTRFRSELKRLHGRTAGEPLATGAAEDDQPLAGSPGQFVAADLAGIDALQEESQQIVDQEVQRVAVSGRFALITAAVGTTIFWLLMSGPIVALYRGYVDASFATLRSLSGDLQAFPRPEAAMLLTSLLLSILPTAIFAMFMISWAQGRWRIDRAESRIREAHAQAISRLQQARVLRLRWDDPLLADAEFLLSVGADLQQSALIQEARR